MTLSVGTRLGPYEILAAIGAGGMGLSVSRPRYAAGARRGHQGFAGVDPSRRNRASRFRNEALALARLNHPNFG